MSKRRDRGEDAHTVDFPDDLIGEFPEDRRAKIREQLHQSVDYDLERYGELAEAEEYVLKGVLSVLRETGVLAFDASQELISRVRTWLRKWLRVRE